MAQDYEAFLEKFKSKKTTDDCYTPAPVYEAARDWILQDRGWQGARDHPPVLAGRRL
ncbi:MAG: hypothetical protein LIO54_03590 [Oscillospiraceae bacterium]|nr:hypothetical protein [Oscillospiraceae bacterium]